MVNKKDNDIIIIDLREMFYLLLHRIWIIILITAVGAIGTCLVSMYLLTPIYTSSSKVYLINRQDENKTTYYDLQMGTQLTKDYSILVKGHEILEQVIARFNLDIDYEAFDKMIEVSNPEDTRILEIKVSYDDPELARLLADTITELSSDKMVDIMEMKKVNVLEAANLPTNPSSPNIIINTLIGGLTSFALTSIIIVMNHLFNNNIVSSDDIENYLKISVLGIIPLEENKVKNKRIKARAIRKKYHFAELDENTYATDSLFK